MACIMKYCNAGVVTWFICELASAAC